MSRRHKHIAKVAHGASRINDLTDDANAMTQSQGNMSSTWNRPIPFDGPPGQLFNPGRPLMPTRPDEQPRIFQYRPGYNLVYIPRMAANLIPFSTLRILGDSCYQVRFCIELLKREVRALKWKVVPADDQDPKKESDEYAQKAKEITEWLSSPDGLVDFDSYNNQMVEEVLVTDALTIYPEVTIGGNCQTVQQIDGTTITPLIDYRGRLPHNPGEPAYLQTLYGIPTSWWDMYSLIYKPMNYSINQAYGKSPIENFILMINTMLRHDAFRLGKFSDGNMPAAFAGLPSTWTQTQIETWQKYWDSLVSGNISEQTKIHFLPHDSGQLPVYEFNQSSVVDVELDKFLMTVACWAFGIAPSEFGITPGQGLGGSGYMAGMQDIQYRSILAPLTQFMENLWTEIIQKYKAPYLKFKWQGLDPTEDSLKQAQVDQINLSLGKHDVTYIQDRDGIPMVNRPSGATMTQPGSFENNPDGSYTPVTGKVQTMQPTNPVSMDALEPMEYVPAIDPIQLMAIGDLAKGINRLVDEIDKNKQYD